MAINTPPVAASRQPRSVIQLGGLSIPGLASWSVSNNSYYEADTFTIRYASSVVPMNWFSMQKEIFAEIFAGFPANPANPQPSELESLIYGRIDTIEFEPHPGILTLTGRDLTAAFIDARVSTQYQNKTSSQVATALAQEHGLTPVVTPTSTLIGTYYTRDQVQLASNRSEWDLLSLLAREEGFVCFVSGQSLYFEPDPRSTQNPYLIQWQAPDDTHGSPIANVKSIEFSRSMTVAKGISVTVRSPSLTRKTAVVQSYPTGPKAIAAGKSSPFGATQSFYFTLPAGKTPTEVALYAQQVYEDIISHEMKMTAHLPADNLLQISTPIQVTGTGTAFDQIYFPRLITREMNMDDGYNMTVEAQNTNQDESPSQ